MAIVFFEGFERWDDGTDFLTADYIEGSTNQEETIFVSANGVGSSKHLQMTGRTTNVTGININKKGLISDIVNDDLIIGWHMLLDTNFAFAKDFIVSIYENTNDRLQVILQRTSSGSPQQIIFGDSSFIFYTHDTALPVNTWIHVQVFLNRTDGQVEFFVNGTQVWTSTNSINDFTIQWNKTQNANAGDSIARLDNFYVSTGSINPGELTGDIEFPNGDVGNTGFDLDGEASVTDALNASAKAVSSTFASNNFEVNIGDVTLGGASIHSVFVSFEVSSLTVGLAKFDIVVNDTNGTQTVVLENSAPIGTTQMSIDVPLDLLGNTWTESTFNSITVKVIHQ